MKAVFAYFLLIISNLAFSQSHHVYSWSVLENASPDTVYAISFSKEKRREIPKELARFTNLQYLDLEKNKLMELPNFIGDFKQLKYLNVARNNLSQFPIEICRLTNLEELILNRNNFETIPECIQYAKSIKYMDVYDTPIRSLPKTLTELPALEKIDFTGIRFSPTFQEMWFDLLPNVELVFDEPCDCME